MNRRTVLKGGLALALSSHTTAAAPVSDAALASLIAAKEACTEALLHQMDFTDQHLELGTATDEIWQMQFDVGDKLDQAVLKIFAYRPRDANEADQKARLLLEWVQDTEISRGECDALLRSMLIDGKAVQA